MRGAPAAAFANPVFDAQRVFRSVLGALSRPGQAQEIRVDLVPPSPLPPELAAIALALADHDAPLWLDPPLAAVSEVSAYLRFHTGAPLVAHPAEAAFALITDPAEMLPFSAFAQGSDEYPDRSITLVIAVDSFEQGEDIRLAGPGIRDQIGLAVKGGPRDLAARLAANSALFPRGVDVILVAPGRVVGIPRSSRIVEPA